jgi:hypothetical protein
MARNQDHPFWMLDPEEVVTLVNRTSKNFILELPTGRCRLDAGRRIRTLRSIAHIPEVKNLLDRGELAFE